MYVMLWELNRVGFGIDDWKVDLRILVVSDYQNSPPQLFESEEHKSNISSRENVFQFNISPG